MQYITANIVCPRYKIYPRFLDKMSISANAKVIYVDLLDRSFTSRHNGKEWVDSKGRVFVRCSNAEAGDMVGKKERIAKEYLKELKDAGLIECKRNYSKSNTIYVGYPDGEELFDYQSGNILPNCNDHQAENCPTIGQNSAQQSGRKLPTSRYIHSKYKHSRLDGGAQSDPQFEEVSEFFIDNGSTTRYANQFMRYYEGLGWQTKNGSPIINWKPIALNWIDREQEKQQADGADFPRL